MSTYWLRGKLANAKNISFTSNDSFITVVLPKKTEVIYYPDSSEYCVNADVVKKAKDLGATIIVHPDAWSAPTFDGKEYASDLKINIMKCASFFAYLRRKGVII